jgi:hypothetical protein
MMHPTQAFSTLVNDVEDGLPVDWWTSSTSFFRRTFLRNFDHAFIHKYNLGDFETFADDEHAFANSWLTIKAVNFNSHDYVNKIDAEDGRIGIICNIDSSIKQYIPTQCTIAQVDDGVVLSNISSSRLMFTPEEFDRVDRIRPLGVEQVFLQPDINSDSYIVWWVVPRMLPPVVANSIRSWITNNWLVNKITQKHVIYTIVGIMCVALGLYLTPKRLSHFGSWCCEKWEYFFSKTSVSPKDPLRTHVAIVDTPSNESYYHERKAEDESGKGISAHRKRAEHSGFGRIGYAQKSANQTERSTNYREHVRHEREDFNRRDKKEDEDDFPDDYKVKREAKKNFYMYDINDWSKAIPSLGLQMYNPQSKKTIRAHNLEEYRQYESLGWKPFINSNTYIDVDGDLYKSNRKLYVDGWKYIQWYNSNYSATVHPPAHLHGVIKTMLNKLSMKLVNMRDGPLKGLDTIVNSPTNPEPKVGKAEQDAFNDYIKGSSSWDTGTFVEPRFRVRQPRPCRYRRFEWAPIACDNRREELVSRCG